MVSNLQFFIDGAKLHASLIALDTQVDEPAQMKMLAWVMELPHEVDPADAARLVIEQQQSRASDIPLISAALMSLIKVVAQYPRERLMAVKSVNRRARFS